VSELLLAISEKVTLEGFKVLQFLAIREFAHGIDGEFVADFVSNLSRDFFTDQSGGSVGFEHLTPRVDVFVTVGAGGIISVNAKLVPNGQLGEVGVGFVEGGNIGWGRRWRIIEEVLADKDGSFDDAGVVAGGVAEEDGALCENPAAMFGFGDFAEVASVDAFDLIVFCQLFVDHLKLGLDEVPGGEVVAEDFSKEVEGFVAEVVFQMWSGFPVNGGVNLNAINGIHIEPLGGEALDELPGVRGGHHAFNLLFEDFGLGEFVLVSQFPQGGIGHGIPKEIGESGGNFVGIELSFFCRLRLH